MGKQMLVSNGGGSSQRRHAAVPFFVLNSLSTASIMFDYYYRVWRRQSSGRYDLLLWQSRFEADSVQAADSEAHNIAQHFAELCGDCSVEYSIAREARSPYVVYSPPF